MPGTSGALNAITAPNAYSAAATIDSGVLLSHVNIDVANQVIFWQIKQIMRDGDPPQLASWQPEVQMSPGSRSIDRPGLVGVRVRAAVAAASLPAGTAQAVVTVEAVLQ